jgi:hypothetical protein
MGGEREQLPRPPTTAGDTDTEATYKANGKVADAEQSARQDAVVEQRASERGAKEPAAEVAPPVVVSSAAPNLKAEPPVPVKPATALPETKVDERSAPAAPESQEAQAATGAEKLYLNLLDDEGEFRAGQLAKIKIQAGRGAYGKTPVANAEVTIKVLGTTFRPLILSTRTDDAGLAVVRALLPRFTSGRAAIIIRISIGDEVAELRRIIHQS